MRRYPILWLLLAAVLLAACSGALEPGDDEPAHRSDLVSRNYDRQTSFDVLPVVEPGSQFSGITGVWDGRCRVYRVYSYDIGERHVAGAGLSDTLTLDLWVTTRCPSPEARFDELRVLLDMSHPSFHDSQAIDVEAFHPGGDTLRRRVILSRHLTAIIPQQATACIEPRPTTRVAVSPVLRIDPLLTCTEAQEHDSLRLTLRFDPPLYQTDLARGPRPLRLAVELTDTEQISSLVEHFTFTLSSR